MPWAERVRTEQPTEAGVGIDWENPLARGLINAFLPTSGTRTPIDLCSSTKLTVGNAATTRNIGPKGETFRFAGGGYGFDITTPPALISSIVVLSPHTGGRSWFIENSSSTGNYFSINTSNVPELNVASGIRASGTAITVGDTVVLGYVAANTDYRLYQNGVLKGSATSASGNFGYPNHLFGSSVYGSQAAFNVALMLNFSRALTPAEVVSLSANPWQLFEKERVWVPVPVDTRAKTYLSRIRTEQPVDAARIAPEYASRVVDGFVGAGGLTLKGKPIDETAYITKTPSAMGVGRRGTANAGFSFPCDLSSMGAITLVFQFIQHSRSGIQMLVEHSANANSNHGTFFIYTDTGANSLVVGTQSWGNYDYGSIALPALDRVTTLAVRMKTSTAGAAGDLEVWVNGAAQTLTPDASAYLDYTFENYSTYFLGRGGLTYLADATIGMYVAMSGTVSDVTMKGISANPWQLFENEQVCLLPLNAAGAVGADATITQANGASTAGSLTGAAGTTGACSAAAGTSTAAGLGGAGTVSTSATQADGVSAAGVLPGEAISSASISQAACVSAVSDLSGNSVAVAAVTSAAGASTASSVTATSSSAAASDISLGGSTAAALAASASSTAVLFASTGASTAEALVGSTANGSTITQADGVSATSVLGATATATTGGSQADGISAASVLEGVTIAATTPSTADGVSTAGTLVGVGSTAGSAGITAGEGTSTTSALTGGASATATVTTATGVSLAAEVVGAGTAFVALTAAGGTTVSGTLAGAGVAPTIASTAAGTSSAAALAASAAASSNTAQADGLSSTVALIATATATADISLGAGASFTSALGASGNAPADVSTATGSSTTPVLGGVATHTASLTGAAGASTASAFAASAVAATIAIAAASVSSARALAGTPPNTAGASGVVHGVDAEDRTTAVGVDVRALAVPEDLREETVTT